MSYVHKSFKLTLISVLSIIAIATVYFFISSFISNNDDTKSDVVINNIKVNDTKKDEDSKNINFPDKEVLIENLEIPWGIEFLPNGNLLITERVGRLLHFDVGSGEKEFINIPTAEHVGEGGLLGIALHPNFIENNFVYLYMTTRSEGSLVNRVERYRWQNGILSGGEIIISDISGAVYHDGGRIKFGPEEDGQRYLYITTGDAGIPRLSQDDNNLAGKILRISDGGSVPNDNPFNNEIYSYGHRNPQGITWDSQNRLWSTEHGPVANDELNLIEKGRNYGWPDSVGDEVLSQTVGPIIHSGNNTWAPAGVTYWQGSIFFVGLRGSAIYEAVLNDDRVVEFKEHYKNEFGRIRDIRVGPDEMFYILTSNRDGRGNPREGDDKVIRINPHQFR